MANILVTGSNRGLGLEFIKHLAGLPSSQIQKVFAVTRKADNGQLGQLVRDSKGRVEEVVIEDITNEDSTAKGVAKVAASLDGQGLDILINNAGTCPANPEGVHTMSGKELLDVLNVNVVSVQVVSAGFLPLLKKGSQKKILNISTTLGSISKVQKYSWAPTYAYKVSKAGMNMLTTQWAMDLKKEGFTVFAMSPGWLKTDLGSQKADLEASQGATAVLEKLFAANQSDSGKFWNIKVAGWEKTERVNQYEGGEVEW